ncbi:MAG: transporter [Gemmatimonadota bacterium]
MTLSQSVASPAAPALGRVLLFAAIPVLTMSLGALLSTVWLPKRRMRSLIQHFAAGVVFSVISVELLPDFLHEDVIWIVALGFSAGVALMLALRLIPGAAPPHQLIVGSGDEETDSPSSNAIGLLVPIGIDSLLDGVLIGIGFLAGGHAGVLLALALGLEMFSMGLALATTIRGPGSSRPRHRAAGALVTIGLSLLILVGAAAGITFLGHLSPHAVSGVLAFASAALLFLVTEELLVRAHENAETALATAMFFVGYLAFLVLGMLGEVGR